MNAIAEPTPASFIHPAARYFAATRPPFLSATLVACLLGLATAMRSGTAIDLPLAGLTVALALLVHAAANVLNDYYDSLNGTDDINTERLFPFTGGSRFIQNGILSRSQTARFGYALLTVAMLGGLGLAAKVGTGLLAIGATGVIIGWAYSAAPFRLNSRGLGEFCVLTGFLGVVAGTDFVQRGAFSVAPLLIGLPYAMLVTNLLYINQFPDRRADATVGKHHWVVRLSLPAAVRTYPALALFALLWLAGLVMAGYLPAGAILSAIPMLLSFRSAVILQRHAAQPSALLPAIRYTIVAMLAHGILLALLLWGTAA